mmetsp:Transcript_23201/g.51532  ORF Transcript_23201/g.51532 Transcript_23201/m.51532 type:complete len:262 (+) Transcript_23201:771-1556(+)
MCFTREGMASSSSLRTRQLGLAQSCLSVSVRRVQREGASSAMTGSFRTTRRRTMGSSSSTKRSTRSDRCRATASGPTLAAASTTRSASSLRTPGMGSLASCAATGPSSTRKGLAPTAAKKGSNSGMAMLRTSGSGSWVRSITQVHTSATSEPAKTPARDPIFLERASRTRQEVESCAAFTMGSRSLVSASVCPCFFSSAAKACTLSTPITCTVWLSSPTMACSSARKCPPTSSASPRAANARNSEEAARLTMGSSSRHRRE